MTSTSNETKLAPDLEFVTIMSNGYIKDELPLAHHEVFRRISAAGVPKRYQDARLADIVPQIAATRAAKGTLEWAEADLGANGLFFIGNPGTGKTFLAAAALNERILKGLRGAMFFNAPILLDEIRNGMKLDDSEARDRFGLACTSSSLVVLDDFGKEKATDWATERLYVLVESRYSAMLPMIVTSNRSINELHDLGYGATVSRLIEMCRVFELSGKDLRPTLTKK